MMLKNNSIIYKYGVIYLVCSALVSSLIVAYMFFNERDAIYQAAYRNNQSILQGIALSIENPLRTSDVRAVSEVIGIYMNLELSYAKVSDSRGIVLLERGELAPYITEQEAKASEMSLQVGDRDQPLGSLKITFSLLKLQDQVSRLRTRLLVVGVAMFMVLSVFTLVVFMLLAGRIRKLDLWVLTTTKKLLGHLPESTVRGNPRDPRPAMDELDRLGGSFSNLLNEINSGREREISSSKFVAIGQTTAMLAHDVRKPFSMVKMLLAALDTIKDNPSELGRARSEIGRAMERVDGMLADIMDFSREVKLDVHPESLPGILDFSVRQAARAHSGVKISFTYRFAHKTKPLVDEQRISRVFVNIIDNAIEAISVIGKKGSGTITIESSDYQGENGRFVEIRISNDGPPIPQDVMPRIFDFFFTQGKIKGTGLGLSSVAKIINLHGGTVAVENLPAGHGVRFTLHLPASGKGEALAAAALPANIEEVPCGDTLPGDIRLDAAIAELSRVKREIKILLLEDEPLYRAAIRNIIKSSEELHKITILYETKHIEDALQLVGNAGITHAIVDIDLNDTRTGFDFLEELRKNFPAVSAMVHSNRTLREDVDKAMKLGAKVFVPKPMSIGDLVSFLSGPVCLGLAAEKSCSSRVVLACDDEILGRKCMGMALQKAAPGAEVHIFQDAESLLAKLKTFLASGRPAEYSVFTDQNMGGMTGLELVAAIRALNTGCKIYMVTNELISEIKSKALAAGADGCFEAPLSEAILAKLLA